MSQPLVGRREVELVGRGEHDALADQGVERHALHLRRLEQLRVDARHLPARPLDLRSRSAASSSTCVIVLTVDLGHRLLVAAFMKRL